MRKLLNVLGIGSLAALIAAALILAGCSDDKKCSDQDGERQQHIGTDKIKGRFVAFTITLIAHHQ